MTEKMILSGFDYAKDVYAEKGIDVEKAMEKTTMNVQELASQMGISLPKAYKLVKQPDFPVIHVGSRILIPVEAYKEWLREGTVRNVRSHEQSTKKII